jgi:hypothetical protein
LQRGRGQDAGVISTVEQFLIRGLDTACGAFVVGLPRSDPRRSVAPLLILAEDPLTGADALAAASNVFAPRLGDGHFRFDLLPDRPNEADELARDGGDDDRRFFAACEHAAIAGA